MTSASQIADNGPTPYFVLIDQALRDEGTSYHYLAPSAFAEAPDAMLRIVLSFPKQRGRVTRRNEGRRSAIRIFLLEGRVEHVQRGHRLALTGVEAGIIVSVMAVIPLGPESVHLIY